MFGRVARHAYDPILQEWLVGSGDYRAMARNLMHDHRVTPARAKEFDRYTAQPRTSDDLYRAVIDYRRGKVQSSSPDFLDVRLNAQNVIAPGAEKLELATVIQLNALLPRLAQWLPGALNPADVGAPTTWLKERLEEPDGTRKGDADVQRVVEQILMARNLARGGGKVWNPTWVVPWKQLRSAMSPGDACWLCVVGVQHSLDDLWFIVLAYAVDRVRTLVRPTQLDSGWYPWHFPSPPRTPLADGGHPMDLRATPPVRLLSEYIHTHIDYNINDWIKADAVCITTNCRTESTMLANRRARHHQLLVKEVGTTVTRWMPMYM